MKRLNRNPYSTYQVTNYQQRPPTPQNLPTLFSQVSHEFFLNLRTDSPYCAGVDGLLQAYFAALHNVQLYGPTNFAPVIRHVTKFAETYQVRTFAAVLPWVVADLWSNMAGLIVTNTSLASPRTAGSTSSS